MSSLRIVERRRDLSVSESVASIEKAHESEHGIHENSCHVSYQRMAFLIPFVVLTVKSVVCGHCSPLIALTIGTLAGLCSFILYRLTKTAIAWKRAIS